MQTEILLDIITETCQILWIYIYIYNNTPSRIYSKPLFIHSWTLNSNLPWTYYPSAKDSDSVVDYPCDFHLYPFPPPVLSVVSDHDRNHIHDLEVSDLNHNRDLSVLNPYQNRTLDLAFLNLDQNRIPDLFA